MEGFQLTAKRFINTTRSHIFLTGKAGTGKTTFLKNLSTFTHKKFIVVAPTGIAALNAGGVTIHSQFLFPFGMFIPEKQNTSVADFSASPYYTSETLAQKHPLNTLRKQVLRSIDLLVIDEVSMLRADIVDAIDYRMRAARGNFRETFGGVQVLFIGDLYQLPPVVKREEEALHKRFYLSPWFYEARCLKDNNLVFIEFNKIFRQADDTFISLLNNIRNDTVTSNDIELLNGHYRSAEEIDKLKEVVTLTTHNYKADELNSRALRALDSKSYFFSAVVSGDFPESMFPVLERLELKVGTQIMFVRNDMDGAYFNGKLATVVEISGSEVWVEMAQSHIRYKLKKERWENKKYALDELTKDLEEEVIGSFEQFPVKLAWAITVHKSQGLTFEKAIIDVAEAFADGQVYVALSRLKSLDGLILRKKINPAAISTDKDVAGFVLSNHHPDSLEERMKASQRDYLVSLVDKTFDFSSIVKDVVYVIRSNHDTIHKESCQACLQPIADSLNGERSNTEKFRRQLGDLLKEDSPQLKDRLIKGSLYYKVILLGHLKSVVSQVELLQHEKRVKTYVNQLSEIDVILNRKIEEMDAVPVMVEDILSGKDEFNLRENSERRNAERTAMIQKIRESLPEIQPKTKKKGKKKKNDGEESTYDTTLRLLKSGLKPTEIASERKLTLSTIEGHLAKAVEGGLLDIYSFCQAEAVDEICAVLTDSPTTSLKELYGRFDGNFSFGLLKAAVAHWKTTTKQAEITDL